MKQITEALAPVERPEKVLMFGEGNFLRAFVVWMIDILNEKTAFNGNVVAVQPIARGLADLINGQKGLYTTVLRGLKDRRPVEEVRAITSLSRCINPYDQFEAYLACAENPDLRFVFSNTTEAGIAWGEGDALGDKPPKSFPAKVTAFLHHRFQHFKGERGKALVFICCELIDKNGEKLKALVERYAEEWGLGPAFAEWLGACDFCSSLVDRVVTGYPRDEAEALWEKIGYRDDLLDTAELFHLWAIETANDYSKELPFADAGLNVVWTPDMAPYRERKVRILNGAHTMTVPVAYLWGLNTVGECMKDDHIYTFMHSAIYGDVTESMTSNEGERWLLQDYAGTVFERFANPFIKHSLLSISLNSISKFKTRVLPSLLEYYERLGRVPHHITLSLAALIAFYKGTRIEDGALVGDRKGEHYLIKDDEDVLRAFAALYSKYGDGSPEAAAALARAVLSNTAWWGQDLCALPGLEERTASVLASIFGGELEWEVGRIG
jgi:tagaturonate reductase